MNIFRPTGMILVPLFVSTIYKKICDEVRKKGKEKLLARGIAATKLARKVGIDLRKPVFAEVRRGLGGRLSKIICGGAARSPILSSASTSWASRSRRATALPNARRWCRSTRIPR